MPQMAAATAVLPCGRELLLVADAPLLPPWELTREPDPTLLPPVEDDDEAGVAPEEDVLSSPLRPVHPTANNTSTKPAQPPHAPVMVCLRCRSRDVCRADARCQQCFTPRGTLPPNASPWPRTLSRKGPGRQHL